ncbi:penicillin acylase family protein [Rubricoccus marinus]|uniref:Penicillin amidase n=1 Tax=Rubricoccus marinus TaxID=716817 RepID=A0A259TZ95_9BACT|nr:penicillin acylase family protein [Rubricoccus marinus]OZC03041.1 hypothetical protein BSZ36_08705 [Rubricoccus marinus]
MSRVFLFLGVALLGVLLLVGALALLAYGPEAQRDGTVEVAGLDAESRVSWSPDAGVAVDADSETALWTGLGYAHTADYGWSVALWRQAALGSLSAWVGTEALEVDRHARQLGFGALAREAYAALPDEDRAAVDAYARGVRLAFDDAAVAERDEFVRLGVDIASWEPWHALAIERMVAWLGTSPEARAAGASGESTAQRDFAHADSLFRDALALGGLEHARAYTANTSEGLTLVSHQPYGASALPLLVGARLSLGGRARTVGTVPGTLILASGANAWSVFLTSDATISPDTSATPPPVFSRLVDRDGDERLIEILRNRQGLVLRAPTNAPRDTLAIDADSGQPVLAEPELEDAGLRLRWTGFQPVSDVGAFRALLASRAPAFRLFRGDGLTVSGGRASVLGSPVVSSRDSGWTFAGAHPTSALAAPRLATLAEQRPALSPEAFATDLGSPWAALDARRLVRALGNRDSLSLDLQDAYAFLRGWDGQYTPEAVAPTIAEAWIDAQRKVFGRDADLRQRADSILIKQTLRLGLATLRDSLGPRAGTWNWDRLVGDLRYPILGSSTGTYAPLASRTGGHPSALVPAGSLVLEGPPGPAVFSMWASGDDVVTLRPSVSRGAPRDGRDPVLRRLWRRSSPEAPVLRLVPAR